MLAPSLHRIGDQRSSWWAIGQAKAADSQFYILTKTHPDFDGKYTVFGQVIKGMEVVDKIQVADVLKRAFVKEAGAKP